MKLFSAKGEKCVLPKQDSKGGEEKAIKIEFEAKTGIEVK